jgi:hypothetical protein
LEIEYDGRFKMTWVRSGLLAAVAILAVCAGASASPEAARPADAFVDSIGVNSHYGNAIYTGGNAYADRRIDQKLADLGVRHLRDHSWNDTATGLIDNLYAAYGIRTNLILGETSRSPADLVNLLKQHPGYEAVEGLNEPDFNTRSYNGLTDSPSTHDYSATRAFQSDLYAAIKADPQTQQVKVFSPAMGTPNNSQYLKPIPFDYVSMHSYPSAREPTFNLDPFITQANGMNDPGNPKPIMATETGYYNAPVQFGYVPENVSAKYIPRLFAEYFNRGIQRSYLYELADQGPDKTDREQNFGLIHFDMTEKPAYTAMKNLIDLLEEPGMTSFPAGMLDYTVSGSADLSKLHHTLLEKSGGIFYLLLWQEAAGFNRSSGTEIVNSTLDVTLSFAHSMSQVRTYLTNQSLSPTAMYADTSSINLSVPDQMMVVEISSVPEPSLAGIGAILIAMRCRRRRGRRRIALPAAFR